MYVKGNKKCHNSSKESSTEVTFSGAYSAIHDFNIA